MSSPKKKQARYLRSNMSLPEVLLWKRLQKDQTGFRIRRQFPIGNYILDFYCWEIFVAIEVDGKDHCFRKTQDAIRDHWLRSEGITVLRISALSVLKNVDFAVQTIKEELERVKLSKTEKQDAPFLEGPVNKERSEPGE